jgi:hypothetical protein
MILDCFSRERHEKEANTKAATKNAKSAASKQQHKEAAMAAYQAQEDLGDYLNFWGSRHTDDDI